jgi:putative ABC transport system permease protein
MSQFAKFRRSPRRTPLAWRNIVDNKVTLLISTGAIGFAVLIMFMEVGFLNGLYDSQTGAFQILRADLVMVSRSLHILNTHETFPLVRLSQASGFAGVRRTCPIYLEDLASDLRNPASGVTNGIRVLAINPDDLVFEGRELNTLVPRLRTHMTILFDQRSRSFFGPVQEGMQTELAERAVTVAGTFDLGPDYYYDGNVITSIETFFTLFPHRQRSEVSLGVIQLEPGASAAAVLRELSASQPADVEILQKSDIVAREKATWQKATPAGYVFTMGVAVGFIIGIFICYQILYTDITDHLPQLATMKALGYHHRDLVRLVLTQAVTLGALGFIPALLTSFGLYSILTAITGIVTKLTFARVALVFALTIAMCFVSGLLAVRKALAVDPAELF